MHAAEDGIAVLLQVLVQVWALVVKLVEALDPLTSVVVGHSMELAKVVAVEGEGDPALMVAVVEEVPEVPT